MDMPLSTEPGEFSAIATMKRWFDGRGFAQDCDIEVEHIDLEKAKVEDIIALCMEPNAIRLSTMARDLAGIDKDNGPEAAVYVVAPPAATVCKIGVAKNPRARLRGLQTSYPEQLELHAIFWAVEGCPERIEGAALRAASAMGVRLKGEWIDGTPELAALLIASAIKAEKVRIADGAMMLRQRERIRSERRAWI